MKTNFGIYCLYDPDIQAFIPESLSVFVSDEQACRALTRAILNMKPEQREIMTSRRFYHVGDFNVDVIPESSTELTSHVMSLVNMAVAKEFEKDV